MHTNTNNKTYLIGYILFDIFRIKMKEGTLRVRYKPNAEEAIAGAKHYLKTVYRHADIVAIYSCEEEIPVQQNRIIITVTVSIGTVAP